jgi:hypothetical protein
MQEVHVTVDADGNPTYKTKGFTGTNCKVVQEIMAQVGAVSDVHLTDEAYKKAERPNYNELHQK